MATSRNQLNEVMSLMHAFTGPEEQKRRELHHQLQEVLQRQQQRAAGGVASSPRGGVSGGPEGTGNASGRVQRTPRPPPSPDLILPPQTATSSGPHATQYSKICKWQQQRQREHKERRILQAEKREQRKRQDWEKKHRPGSPRMKKSSGGDDDATKEEHATPDTGLQPKYVELKFSKDIRSHVNASTARVRYCAGGGTSSTKTFSKYGSPTMTFIDERADGSSFGMENASPRAGGAQTARIGMTPRSGSQNESTALDLGGLRVALGIDDRSLSNSGEQLSIMNDASLVPRVRPPPEKDGSGSDGETGGEIRRRSLVHRNGASFITETRISPPGRSGSTSKRDSSPPSSSRAPHRLSVSASMMARRGSNVSTGDLSNSGSMRIMTAPRRKSHAATLIEEHQKVPPSASGIRRPHVPVPWTCKVSFSEVKEIDSIAALRERVERNQGSRGEGLSRLIPEGSLDMELVAKSIASSNNDFRRMISYRPQDTKQREEEVTKRHRGSIWTKMGGEEQHIHFESLIRQDQRNLYRQGADEIRRWIVDRNRLYGMKFQRMDVAGGGISWQRTLTRIRGEISKALEEEFSAERRELQDEFIVKFLRAFEVRFPVMSEEAERVIGLVHSVFTADRPFGAHQIASLIDALPVDYLVIPDVISFIFALAMNLNIDDAFWLAKIKVRTQFMDGANDSKRKSDSALRDLKEWGTSAKWVLKLQPNQHSASVLKWALGTAANTLTKEELVELMQYRCQLPMLVAFILESTPGSLLPEIVDCLQKMIQFSPWSKEFEKMEVKEALTLWCRKCHGVQGGHGGGGHHGGQHGIHLTHTTSASMLSPVMSMNPGAYPSGLLNTATQHSTPTGASATTTGNSALMAAPSGTAISLPALSGATSSTN